jgi:hypothetical protein
MLISDCPFFKKRMKYHEEANHRQEAWLEGSVVTFQHQVATGSGRHKLSRMRHHSAPFM